MTQITRIYGSPQLAADVYRALREDRFAERHLTMITPGAAEDALVASLEAAHIPAASARIYAAEIGKGGALVSVRPPYGSAADAMRVMDRFQAVDVGVADTTSTIAVAQAEDPATPLSSALGWTVLSSNPTPLSSWLGWSTLVRKKPSASLRPHFSLSKAVGLPLLSHDAAPLSRLVGMPVLLNQPAPLSSKIGWPTLLKKAAPLSDKLGWATLSRKATPLSDALGWKVLTDKQR